MYRTAHILAAFLVICIAINFVYQFLLVTAPILPSNPPLSSDKPKPHLHLTSNNTFNIAIISDLHYGEDESTVGPEKDRKSTQVIAKILDFEEPDFVIINGDLITGDDTHLENSTKYVDQIVSPMVQRNHSWASTYGNHDTQYNLSREDLFREETKYDLSYTRHSPEGVGGVTNYWLPIHASSAPDAPVVAILWFFDSQGGEKFQRWGLAKWMPNWVESSAVSWFRSERSAIENRWGSLPSLAFVHIPPTPFLRLQGKILPEKGDKDIHLPGLNYDVPVANQGEGRWGQRDKMFVKALLETNGLHSVYSGHDHGNSWCGTWDGEDEVVTPVLCFVKHTGYGGYGNWMRGSRVVELRFGDGSKENGREGRTSRVMEVETWLRMESGTVVQKVSLNETYGTDIYPMDDGEE